jgi:NADPH:quinone reductase-like Zn-dependent oxidoreductase
MRAAVLKEIGGVPEVGEFNDPSGDEDGVLIDVSVAGMNPVDVFIATGKMPWVKPDPPAVAGQEGIGTVAGEDRRVYFNGCVHPFGSFAERTVAKPEAIIDVPDGVEDATALAFGIAGMAGWISLAWRADLQAGETVLVLGASGVVGRIAIQAAKLLGAGTVIAAARNGDELKRAAELGADETVEITDDGFGDGLRDVAPDGIDVIVDPVWGAPAMTAIGAAGHDVRLIQIGNAAAPAAELVAGPFRNNHAVIMGYTNVLAPDEVKAEAFASMCRHAADGDLVVDVEEIALDDIADAWERQQEGPHHKLVIRP